MILFAKFLLGALVLGVWYITEPGGFKLYWSIVILFGALIAAYRLVTRGP